MDTDHETIEITEHLTDSPDPPQWEYDAWGYDPDGALHHKRYGRWWAREFDHELIWIELEGFRLGGTEKEGGITKYDHLVNCVDLLWNSGKTKHVEWNPWLEKMLQECCNHDYVGVAGASSTSKSFGGAIWVWVNGLASPLETLCLVTSTSISAAKKRIWKSVTQLYNNLPPAAKALYKPMASQNMFRAIQKTGVLPNDAASISLIAAEAKQEASAVAKLVGLKNKRVFFCADELCELSHSIVAAADNLMSNPEFHMVAMSNPKDREDPFGVFMEPEDGWNSIDESSFEWKTKMGIAIRFDVLQSPNYLERENIYKYMLTYDKVERARKQHGETSARFYRFFRGFFPIQGQEDVLYSETDFRAYVKDRIEWRGLPVKIAAMDPAQSSGGDRSILMIMLFGEDQAGLKCLEYVTHHHLKEDAADKLRPFNEQMVGQVKAILDAEGIHPSNFVIDNTGNKAFAEWLIKEVGREIVRVEFGGKASEKPVGATDRTPSHKRYCNRVSELWGCSIEFLRGGQVSGLRKCPELMQEMKSRRYEMVKGGDGERMKVEPKNEMKLRAGKSPDLADSLFLGFELCRQKFHWRSEERGIAVMKDADYDQACRDLDIVTLSSGGIHDWYPIAC